MVVVIAVALTGCSSPQQGSGAGSATSDRASTSNAAPTEGTGVGKVHGRLVLVGGPARKAEATGGTVKVWGGSRTRVPVDRHGHFQVVVAPGTYHLTGTSPRYGNGRYLCRAAHATSVVAAGISRVDVYCQRR